MTEKQKPTGAKPEIQNPRYERATPEMVAPRGDAAQAEGRRQEG